MARPEARDGPSRHVFCGHGRQLQSEAGAPTSPQGGSATSRSSGPPRNAKIPFFEKRTESPRPPRDDDWFEDITQAAGIDFTYRDGQEAGFYQLVENLGGCVGMLDFDKDGDIDLFFTGGGSLSGPPIKIAGRPSVFYRNDGGLRFRDVTQEVGVQGGGLLLARLRRWRLRSRRLARYLRRRLSRLQPLSEQSEGGI